MDAADLIKRVRRIEIKTRKTQNLFAGEYHSAFKGKGMSFSEVREYQFGDDIRNIDWNVTARFNHPYIKVFEEERELTVILLVDVSGSREFGSHDLTKKNLITEISAVLSFSAINNNDKIGVIMFSDKIEKFISPQKGRQHILRIIRELINFIPENKGTNLSEALRYLTNTIKKRATVFLLSDFIDNNYEDALKIASRKHDLIALNIVDERESELPPIGMVRMKDAETGKMLWVNTNSKKVRKSYQENFTERVSTARQLFLKHGVDSATIATHEDYIKPLMNLFKKRI